MADNSFVKIVKFIKNLLIYKVPVTRHPFVLEETKPPKPESPSELLSSLNELKTAVRFAYRVEKALQQTQNILSTNPTPDKIKAIQKELQSLELQIKETSPVLLSYTAREKTSDTGISASLEENITTITKLFELPDNNDFIIRQLFIPMKPALKAALLFSKTLVDKKDINSTILSPLFNAKNIDSLAGDVLTILTTQVLPINQVKTVKDFASVMKAVQAGDTVLFVDGSAGAVLIETKGFEHRGISIPRIEQTIRGNQSSFTDTLLINISMVRLSLRTPDLVVDTITVGARSQTDCAVLYLKSVANPSLLQEVKRRISEIKTDYLGAGMLEQFIEDHPSIPLPQILSTERPDRVTSHLAEGRIAILVDGDPFALIAPISFFTLFHSPEDFTLKMPAGLFNRILRLLSGFLSMVFPAIYIAITYFHLEALPTDLVLAIAGARERIPFPSLIEIAFMEISLEFIREAGLRKPGLLGETLGIVGGIILGQAVVSANLVSPITVVIVAITAIASFAIPDFRVGMAIRQVRFLFEIIAAMLGLIGVGSAIFVYIVVLCSMKSFGVPYMSPIAPRTSSGLDVIARGPTYRQEERPDELGPLAAKRQPKISRKWSLKHPKEDGSG
jgi:spore germination protein KA